MTHKFIDLFAGIGGFRLGFQQAGFSCVFSSEIDKHASSLSEKEILDTDCTDKSTLNHCLSVKPVSKLTSGGLLRQPAREMYYATFNELPFGDITKIDVQTIPEFDILLAGFPCQPFSIAGGKKEFGDIRGTLFFDIARIIEYHRPKVVVLENVEHFKNHDKGRTLQIVLNTLEKMGYVTNWHLLNAKDFGVPQNRERTIIIGSMDGVEFDFRELKRKYPINSIVVPMVAESAKQVKKQLFDAFYRENYVPKWKQQRLFEFDDAIDPTISTNNVVCASDYEEELMLL